MPLEIKARFDLKVAPSFGFKQGLERLPHGGRAFQPNRESQDGGGAVVIAYQSESFRAALPESTRNLELWGLGDLRWIKPTGEEPRFTSEGTLLHGSADTALESMREQMLAGTQPVAAVFVGGMEGILDEAAIFRRLCEGRPLYFVGAPGGAARELAEREQAELTPVSGLTPQELLHARNYPSLIQRIVLDISARGRRFSWARVAGAVVLATVVAALAVATQAADRTFTSTADKSVENRVTLWAGALRMLAENPRGVGRGMSGEAYMQWYQPLEASARYRTLVNSYLTFTVERGLAVAGLVALATLLVWGLTARAGGSVGFGLRGALVAFAVAGIFSTTMEEWRLWVVPGLCVAGSRAWRLADGARFPQGAHFSLRRWVRSRSALSYGVRVRGSLGGLL